MQFVIYRDNGAQFHWRLKGSRLAVFAVAFSSAYDARRPGAQVHEHAGSATGTEV
jgi:uncharacterized protein YegP (UPF0339 family)